MGRHHLERKQMELLPEEALYMVERGVIELWREGEATDDGFARVPMSVQQAWSELIGHDELTVERFQVSVLLASLSVISGRLPPTGLRLPQATRLRPESRARHSRNCRSSR